MQPTRTGSARTEGANASATMPPAQPAHIAGPRRGRPISSPPPLPADVVAKSTARSATPSAVPSSLPPARALVPLDYDEVRPAVATTAVAGATVRRRSRRVGWFILGVAFGAMGAVGATGEMGHTLRTARAWGGTALRSLEHKPAAAPSQEAPQATTVSIPRVRMASSKPCPMDPSEDDPCAALLAPFAGAAVSEPGANVPTVPVEDLPQAKPPLAAVPARAHTRATATATSQSASPATTTEPQRQDVPRGINPDIEDSQASPEKPAPVRPPPDVEPAGTAVAPT
jgi:hypothetical protein